MVAPDYEDHAGNVPAFDSDQYRAWVTTINSLVPPTTTDALDVATGTGFVALILAALGHRVTAIDLSAEMLHQAAATAADRQLSIRFQPGDAVDPDFAPERFDVLTSRHLLWTLREPHRALSNWRTLLRPNGTVIAFDGFWFDPRPGPHDNEPEPFRRHYTTETRAALPFMHLDTIDPILEAFEGAGFRDVDWRSMPQLADDTTEQGAPYLITASA
jgi:SAM-dependent methyltransferase